MGQFVVVVDVVVCLLLCLLLSSSFALEFTVKEVGRKSKVLQFDEQLARHQNIKKQEENPLAPNEAEFLDNFLSEFGLTQDNIKFSHKYEVQSATILHYDQFFRGVKVLGGRLTVTFGSHGEVIRAMGGALSDVSGMEHLPSISSLSSSAALQSVKNYIAANYNSKTLEMVGTKTELVYHRGNLGSDVTPGTPTLAHHIEGKSLLLDNGEHKDIYYDSFVDASTGEVLRFISEGETSEHRSKEVNKTGMKRYLQAASDTQNITGGITNLSEFGEGNEILIYECTGSTKINHCNIHRILLWQSSTGPWPSEREDVNIAVASIVQFQRLMKSLTGGTWVSHLQNRSDINVHINMGGNSRSYAHTMNGIYLSAGDFTEVCIAHEVMHGYTKTSSGLEYEYESGALNEALSDIFASMLDILNSQSNLTTIRVADALNMQSPRQLNQSCSNVEWNMKNSEYTNDPTSADRLGPGTDTSQWWLYGRLAKSGAIRDMYYPECFGHPGSKGSSKYYCGQNDNGGVHTNAGVPNRLFAFMVQGGINNDIDLPALGMNKSASLMWNTLMAIGPATTFPQFAEVLSFQCNLAINSTFYVPNFMTGDSVLDTEVVSQLDCDHLELIIAASRMREDINCSTNPTEPPTFAPTRENSLPMFSVSNTDFARNAANSENVEVEICPGLLYQFSICDDDHKCSDRAAGDSVLRLYNGDEQVAFDDDSCGSCPNLRYFLPENATACVSMTLREGCYGDYDCSGAVHVYTTHFPSAVPTLAPTAIPTAAPSIPRTEWVETTGLRQMSGTHSASNENAESYCFDLTVPSALQVRSFHQECYDTRVGDGDAYIRLRRDSETGEVIGENDDMLYPECMDSELEFPVLKPGRYCLIMGCYSDSACSYDGMVTAFSKTDAPTVAPSDFSYMNSWEVRTGVRAMEGTHSASNEKTEAYCFDLTVPTTVLGRSFHQDCYDTRVGKEGDAYIRMRRGSETGPIIAENDDMLFPDCTDSRFILPDLPVGQYCLMMGCYSDTACSYEGELTGIPSPQDKHGDGGHEMEWSRYTGLIEVTNTHSASNENSHVECFNVTEPVMITARSFATTCGDMRVNGDSYIRLQKGVPFPYNEYNKIDENDDTSPGVCTDSEMMTELSDPGQYCVFFGCYADDSCSYEGTISASSFTDQSGGLGDELKKTPDDTEINTNVGVITIVSITINIVIAILVLARIFYFVYSKYTANDSVYKMEVETETHIHPQQNPLSQKLSMTDKVGGQKMGDVQVFVDKGLYRDLSFRADTPESLVRGDAPSIFPAAAEQDADDAV